MDDEITHSCFAASSPAMARAQVHAARSSRSALSVRPAPCGPVLSRVLLHRRVAAKVSDSARSLRPAAKARSFDRAFLPYHERSAGQRGIERGPDHSPTPWSASQDSGARTMGPWRAAVARAGAMRLKKGTGIPIALNMPTGPPSASRTSQAARTRASTNRISPQIAKADKASADARESTSQLGASEAAEKKAKLREELAI